MMRSSKLLFFLILCLCYSFPSTAQTLHQKHQMNALVLDKVENLETFSTLKDRSTRYQFIQLFTSGSLEIFCDQYSNSKFLENISVSQYAKFFETNCETTVFCSFQDVKKTKLDKGSDCWHYTISLTKKYGYTDNNGVLFPIDEKEEHLFKLDITFLIDADITSCKIERITCSNVKDFDKLDGGFVIQKNTTKKEVKYDEEISVNDEKLTFNSMEQAFTYSNQFLHPNTDLQIKSEEIESTDVYSLIQLRYRSRNGRLRLRMEYSPSVYKISTNSDFSQSSSAGFTMGLDIGGAFSVGKIARLGAYTGLACAYSQLNLAASNLSYRYDLSDYSGQKYSRCYNIQSASQGAQFHDLMIPAYINVDFSLDKKKIVFLFLDAGAKVYFNTNARVTPFHVEGEVSGERKGKAFTDPTLAFGSLTGDYNQFITPVSFNRNPIDVSVFGAVGLDINVVKNILFVEVKGGYEYGITKTYQSQQSVFYSEGETVYPIVYSYQLNKDVVVRPLADCVSFRRQSFNLTAGLMLKF